MATTAAAPKPAEGDDEPQLTLQRMEVIDLPDVTRLEAASLPAHEVVPRDVIDYLVTFANNLSYIAVRDRDGRDAALLGYVVGAGAPSGTTALSRAALNNHCAGDVLVIRSVVVAPDARGHGLDSAILRAYLRKIRQSTAMTRVLALVRPRVVAMYARAGFADLGPRADDDDDGDKDKDNAYHLVSMSL